MACTIDFRCLDEGLGGQRNKRKSPMDFDDATTTVPSKRPALPSLSEPNKPASFGRFTYDGVIAGKVSGRKWKHPRTQRSSACKVTVKGKPFEERERDKQIRKAFRERKEELKEEIRMHKVEKRERKEEREKRKKENVLRSGTKLQRITNPKTLQKIAKSKQKKLLRVVADDIFDKNKNKAGVWILNSSFGMLCRTSSLAPVLRLSLPCVCTLIIKNCNFATTRKSNNSRIS